MRLELNLNDYVTIKLNPLGHKIIEERDEKVFFPIDSEYKTKVPLWQLMYTFGNYLSMGSEIPFENCLIMEK